MNNVETLKFAESFLGDGGSKFRRYCGLPSGAPWCCAFVRYIFSESDNAKLFFDGKNVTYCPTAIQWCRANLAQIPIYIALPSDIIFFDWQLNGVPDHIGMVKERKSDQEIYTIEGNTGVGIVANRLRVDQYILGVFRPEFVPTSYSKNKELEVDGYFGYNSIAMLQKALGVEQDAILGKVTVKALQKRAGVAQDGSWGVKTSKAVQKMIGTKVDGAFGEKSVKALQKWINEQNKSTKKTTKSIGSEAVRLSWPLATARSKYLYQGGSACPNFKSAWNKYYPNKHNIAGCNQFVGLVVKSAGYGDMPVGDWAKTIPWLKKHFDQVPFSYKSGQLREGDIWVRRDGKTYHTLIIVKINGELMIAEAQQKETYSHINPNLAKACRHHDQVWLFRAK